MVCLEDACSIVVVQPISNTSFIHVVTHKTSMEILNIQFCLDAGIDCP